MKARTLYRPVGLKELALILDAEAQAFPPRLPEQPIFYPVLNPEYANEIASEWNPTDPASGLAGFVTEFDVDEQYVQQFEPKVVGAARHQELWIPADELGTFNSKLVAKIRVTAAYCGPKYEGPKPVPLLVKVQNPDDQLKVLHATLTYSGFDFLLEVAANWKLVIANFGYWSAASAERQGFTAEQASETLAAIRKAWEPRHRDLPLPRGTIVATEG